MSLGLNKALEVDEAVIEVRSSERDNVGQRPRPRPALTPAPGTAVSSAVNNEFRHPHEKFFFCFNFDVIVASHFVGLNFD